MKKIVSLVSAVVVVAFVVVVVMGGVASAGGTNTLTVAATLTGTCQFSTAAETMSFALDATQSGNAVSTVTPQFWCTKGTAVTTLAANQGLNFASGSNQMKSSSTGDVIPYSLALTPGGTTGLGKTTPINLTVTGTVLNASYVNATAANDYSDTVTITIAP